MLKVVLTSELRTGLVETIRTLYPVPGVRPVGVVQIIVPAVAEEIVPMFCGVAKLPVASDNCAVNVLLLPKLFDTV